MANEELKQYPRGQCAFGSGDLNQCTDVQFKAVNGAKVLATLRRNPSGIVGGMKFVEVTGNSIIDEDGPERDWFDLVETGKPQQARFKFPGGVTKTMSCVVAEITSDFKLEDPVGQSWRLVGKLLKA